MSATTPQTDRLEHPEAVLRLQQIVGQLIFHGAEDVNVAELPPWLDLRVSPKEIKLPLVEGQTHRRSFR